MSASDIGHRSVSCARKKDYHSEAKAWSVVFKIRAEGGDTERLQPYLCDYCKRWHLGRRPARLASELDQAKIARALKVCNQE